jgi:hypothetical protein
MRIDSAGRVGIGTSAPEGKLHVHSGTAGTTAPSNDADELVLENNGRCGVSLLAPNAENTNLYFGSPSNNGGAFLRWNHDANLLRVSTAQTGAEVAFSAGASNEAMRIDSSSNVGIGTSAPDGKLHVHTGSAGTVTANSEADDLVVENNGNAGISILAPDANYSNFYMGSPTDNIGAYLRWRYSDLEAKLSTSAVGGELVLGSDNGAEAMRIDSSGNVLVGHTDALTVAGSVNRFQVLGTNAPTSQAVLGRFSNDTSSPEFIFLKSRSGTIGSNTIVQDGDDVGTIGFNVDDGVDYQSRIAAIRGELDGSGLAENDVPGRLTFFTTADGAAASTERMRIDSAGRVAIGTTAPEGKLHIYSAASGATTANADADELVLDSNGSCGISLRAPDAENTNIYFASPTDSAGAYIRWNYDASVLRVATDKAGAELALYTGANAERVRIDSAGGVGIGTSNPSAKLHVQDTSSTVLQLDTTGAAGTDMTRLTQFPGQSKLIDIKGTGSSLLELIADPDDGTSTAYVRVNRDTSTTGSSGLQVLRGNGTATSSHILYGLNTGTGADDALLCLNGGSLGVGSSNPTEKLDVNGDAIRVRTSQTPASASATGDAGMICWDANYVYVCTAANTWKRAALATW